MEAAGGSGIWTSAWTGCSTKGWKRTTPCWRRCAPSGGAGNWRLRGWLLLLKSKSRRRSWQAVLRVQTASPKKPRGRRRVKKNRAPCLERRRSAPARTPGASCRAWRGSSSRWGASAAEADAAPAQLHAFRLSAKRFRYTLELFEPMYGPMLAERVEQVRKIQSVLGERQDCVVLDERLRKRGRPAPDRARRAGQAERGGPRAGGEVPPLLALRPSTRGRGGAMGALSVERRPLHGSAAGRGSGAPALRNDSAPRISAPPGRCKRLFERLAARPRTPVGAALHGDRRQTIRAGGEYSRMRMTKIERILCQLRHRPRVSSSRVFTAGVESHAVRRKLTRYTLFRTSVV
jgi:hypothetical protein